MTALAKDRNTKHKRKGPLTVHKVAAGVVIFVGALVAKNAAGFLVPASNAAALTVVGRANGKYAALSGKADNTLGANGDLSVEVEEGIFLWANSGTGPLAQANVGYPCFVEDDQTVSDRGTFGVIAGRVYEIDASGGIWVATFLDEVGEDAGEETVTTGAISVGTRVTFLSVTGTVPYTLADGLYHGQRKFLKCTVAASTPVGTVTPTTASGFATITFDSTADWALIEWRKGSGWKVIAFAAAVVA
jgi:hypothetical protein